MVVVTTRCLCSQLAGTPLVANAQPTSGNNREAVVFGDDGIAPAWSERTEDGVVNVQFTGNPEVQPYDGTTAIEARLNLGGTLSLQTDEAFAGPTFPGGYDAVTFWITGPDALCLNITLDPFVGQTTTQGIRAKAMEKQLSPGCELTTWRQMRIDLDELPDIPWGGINWGDGGQNAATGGGSVFYLDDIRLVGGGGGGEAGGGGGGGAPPETFLPPDDVIDTQPSIPPSVCPSGFTEEFDQIYPAPFPAPDGQLASRWTERTTDGVTDMQFTGNPEVQPYTGRTAIEARLDLGGSLSLQTNEAFAGPTFPDGYDAVTFWITGPDALCLNITLDPFAGGKRVRAKSTFMEKQLSPGCQLTTWQLMQISLDELPDIPWEGINWGDGGQNAATGGGSVFYLDDVRLVKCVEEVDVVVETTTPQVVVPPPVVIPPDVVPPVVIPPDVVPPVVIPPDVVPPVVLPPLPVPDDGGGGGGGGPLLPVTGGIGGGGSPLLPVAPPPPLLPVAPPPPLLPVTGGGGITPAPPLLPVTGGYGGGGYGGGGYGVGIGVGIGGSGGGGAYRARPAPFKRALKWGSLGYLLGSGLSGLVWWQ